MAIPIVDVNYLAVLVAAVVGFLIGAIWYSVLFGKAWTRLSGFTQADMEKAKKKGMAKSYLAMFIATIVMAYVLAHVVAFAQAATFADALMAGFWTWLGFIATVLLGTVLWEGKPVKLYLINVSHYLVVLLVMASILVMWA